VAAAAAVRGRYYSKATRIEAHHVLQSAMESKGLDSRICTMFSAMIAESATVRR
jgi:hypothetical protein